jgi:7-alpha-hydroxysteroid dehydrogenase
MERDFAAEIAAARRGEARAVDSLFARNLPPLVAFIRARSAALAGRDRSSIAATRTQPELLGYSIACAALDQMTRSLAVALAPKRIRVNAVAYGSVMSGHLRGVLRQDEGMRTEIVTHTPLGRIGSPAEVSDAVQYLASDASGFVTGQIITVDGGRTLIDAAAVSAH